MARVGIVHGHGMLPQADRFDLGISAFFRPGAEQKSAR